MPWTDDSKTDPKPRPEPRRELGPWDAPGAAVAPPPKPKAAPRPWDDGGEPGGAAPKRPRLAPRRPPRAPAERPGKSERGPAKPPRQVRAPKAAIPTRSPGPNLEVLKQGLERALAQRLTGPRGRTLRVALAVGGALGLLAGWTAGGLYQVGPDQMAVVERFGAFTAETGPGVHYHLPWPVGRVRLVPVGPAPRADGGAAGAEIDATGRMLAADGAPVEVSYSLTWRVTDPRRYLFRVADAPDLLKTLSEGAVRRAVGAAPLQALLAGDRGAAAAAASADLQRGLDRLGAGVRVGAIEVRGVDAVEAAQGSARDLAAAMQDARAAQADAAGYRARVTAQAKGEAAKALQEARGVADQEIAEAKGEADRFTALDAANRQAPETTRERLYAETMERVLKATDKVVVDAPKGSTLVLPGSVMPQHPADPAQAQPAAPAVAAPPPAGQASVGGAA